MRCSTPFEHTYYMHIALELAKNAAKQGEVPVGAVLVDENGMIIGRGKNSPIGLLDPTAHAEILALREGAEKKGNYRLTGTTLYATIEPCPMCAGAMVHARVERLVFGASDPKTGACGSLYNLVDDIRLNHRIVVVRGVLESEARGLIQDFFRKRRKRRGEVPKRP